MEKLISIIIPVYNAEKNIKKCIDSILKQTYPKIEIICVNDGSTDKSEKIILEYKKKYNNIELINKKNTGVSDTRNMGILKATGEYIMFIDADDYIDINYVEVMNNIANSNNCDLVVSGYTEEKNNISTKKTRYTSKPRIFEISYPAYIDDYLETFEFNPCWKQLIKKKIIIDNNIKFDKKIKYGEDMIFSMECYKNSKSTFYVKNYGYHYYINDESVMQKKDLNALNKYFNDNFTTSNYIETKYNLNKTQYNKLSFKTLKVFDLISSKVIKSNSNTIEKNKLIKINRKQYIKYFKEYNIFSCGTLKENISIMLLKFNMIDVYFLLKKKRNK